jgi:branched-chain amino acid transport system permease protein
MTAAPQTKPQTAQIARATSAAQVVPALRTAFVAALVAFGLAFPIISYHAEANINNELVLTSRWPLSFGISALVFAFVFLRQMSTSDWRIWFDRFGSIAAGGMGGALVQAAREGEGTARPSAARAAFGRYFGPFMLGLVAVFPLLMLGLLGPGGSLKWINNYGVQIMIYVMLGWGLNIVVGLAGLLDLGYVAFYAVGAYSYALLSTTFGLSFWICLPLAGLLAAMWGVILGFPVLRLRGDYLAIVTLAFGEIIRMVLINWVDLTNGYAGISGIPHITFFGIPFNDDDNGFAAIFHIPFSPIYRTIFLFYLILGLALLTNFVTLRMRRLPIGRAWEALREDEIACRSLGINTTTTKLTAFALGAMFGGFAGSFFAVRQGFVSPESFTFIESATILAIVVLGGMGSQIGVAVAAAVMIGVPELMRELDWLKAIFGQDFDPTQYRMLLFGAAMVVMMIWKPRGLVSTRSPSIFLKERKTVSGDLVKEGHG